MTPDELAAELGVTGRALREWLRTTYPRTEVEKHHRWRLDQRMVEEARAHFSTG